MSTLPLLHYNATPTGTPPDMFFYIYLSGIEFCIIMFCFIFGAIRYKEAFLKVIDMIKHITHPTNSFDANSIAILFSIVGFMCYFSITIGDILNATGVADYA
eukprot:Pgem_evm1s16470